MKSLKMIMVKGIALCLAFGMFTASAFAEEQTAQSVRKEENAKLYAENCEAVDLLNFLEILPQDKDALSDRVTRGEFVYMLVKMLRIQEAEGDAIFEDVTADYEFFNQISAAYKLGIINGTTDGRFYPNNFISFNEAVKMTVCALNLKNMANNLGGWPTGYIKTAEKLKITRDIKQADIENMNMASAVKIVFGALSSNSAEVASSKGESYFVLDTEYSYLNTNYEIYRGEGIVTDTENSLYLDDNQDHEGKIGIDGKIVDFANNLSISDSLLGKSVYYYYRGIEGSNDDEIILIGEKKNNILEITGEDVAATDEKSITYWTENDIKKTVNISGAKIYYNGVLSGRLSGCEVNDETIIRLIDNDCNGKYEYLFLETYGQTEIVESASFGKIEAKFSDWKMTAEESEDISFFRDGIKIKPNYLGEWDILKFKYDRYGRLISVDVFYNEVTGTVEAVNQKDKKVTIDQEVYEISDEYISYAENKLYDAYEIKKGMRATFITDDKGKIYGVNTVEEQNKQYGYLVKVAKTSSGLSAKYQAKLFAMFGKMTYCDIADKIKLNGVMVKPSEFEAAMMDGDKFRDGLVMYSLNGKGELCEVDLPVDRTAQGYDNDEFSLDFKFVWDGVSTQTNWTYDNNIRILGGSGGYHVPSAGVTVPAFYIPNDMTEDTYFKYSNAVTGLSSFAKDTDYYLYDAALYTDKYDLKYVGAIVIKERKTTTATSGTTGPYIANSVTSGNYQNMILVEDVLEEVDEKGNVKKVLYGKTVKSREFKASFAETVWNADRENVFGYGNMKVDDIKSGDIVMIAYSNENAAELEIDRFITFLTEKDARKGETFASYFNAGSNTSLSSAVPYFVFGEIVIFRNNQMIIKTKDYNGEDLYLSTTLDTSDTGKIFYNMETGEMDWAKLEMYTTGSRVAFRYNSSKISQIVLYIGE